MDLIHIFVGLFGGKFITICFYFTFFINEVMSRSASKQKCQQYSVEYLKFGFIAALHNEQKPLCLICEKELSNESMKPSRLAKYF